MPRSIRRIAMLSCLALTAGVLVTPTTASADVPVPSLVASGPSQRAAPFFVAASGLNTGASYTLTTDGGFFDDSGASTLVFTAGSDGYLRADVTDTESVSPSDAAVDVTLTATDDPSTTLATAVHVFAAPSLTASICAAAGSTLRVLGLADGDYQLVGPSASFNPALVHAASGRLTTSVTGAANVPPSSSVTLTSVDDPLITYTWSVPRAIPVLAAPLGTPYSPWQLRYTAGCFTPGESVVQVNHSSNSVGVRAVADVHGTARITVDLHPATQGRRADTVVFRGASSGQTVTVAGAQVLGSTLYRGQSLTSASADPWQRRRLLAGASSDTSTAGRTNYLFSGGCNPGLFMHYANGGESTMWQAFPGQYRPGNCWLIFGRGVLVLRNAAGRTTWTSGTRGTQFGNRFVVRPSGRAEIITGTQVTIWRTDRGLVSTPLSAMLRPVGALHRGQSVGWGTVRFGLDRYGNVVVTRAGKVVWVRHTAGLGGVRLRMLADGNVVLRTAHHRTVWSTHTHSPGAALEVSGTGDIGIFNGQGHHQVWHTGTGV